jgi:capsular exopolysaccharide synthesis family protein
MPNEVAWQTSTRAGNPQVANREEPLIDLVEAFRALRRRGGLIASILVLAISVAVIYLATTPPRYTASSMLLFDVRKIEPFQQQAYPNVAADSAFVDSQVEVLKSENIARSVIGNLNLLSDPEFAPPEGGLLTIIRGFMQGIFKAIVGAGKVSAESDQLGRVVRIFQANLTIKRIGLTYVITINYRSLDPNKAAWISNAVAEAYIVGELESKYHAARRANAWLQERVSELKTLAQNTERAVAEYKAKNNVVSTGAAHLNEQQLADLSSQRRVVLKDLETAAQTYRALHETLLQRVAEFTQQQSFPATEARVVSGASPPLEKSDPKALVVLGVASLLGLVGGLGAAFAREYFDNGLRSSAQVEKRVGIDCLGMLPTIAEALRRRWWMPKWHQGSGHSLDNEMSIVDLHDQRQRHKAQAAGGNRIISTAIWEYRFVVDRPFSRFAETIRSLKVAAESAGPGGSKKVIGVTSAVPREGKSLVAANLSEMIAASGSKTLLIDGDSRHRGLTRRLAPGAKAGLTHAVAGQAAVEDLMWRDPNINLEFLPMIRPPPASHSVGTVSSAAMQKLLDSVQDRYDCVIVDLPPLTPVADVKAVSHLIDYFILVIEWGRTSHEAVTDALKTAPHVFEKLLGAVLNKADPTVLKKLESYKGRYYRDYYNAYSS